MTSRAFPRVRHAWAAGLGLAVVVAAAQPLGNPALLRAHEIGLLIVLAAGAAITVLLTAALWRRGRARALLLCLAALLPVIALLMWCRAHLLPFVMESRYVAARDGTALAVDVYRPRSVPQTGLPTILAQTRYLRSIHSAFPYSLLRSPATELAGPFTAAGFAYVVVDVRGTGASEGVWPVPWAEPEIADGVALVDWIGRQPWSNGRVGAHGVSYVGTAAEYLLANRHPAVGGAVVAFSLYDAFDDIVMPGGLWLSVFNEGWERLNALLDSNRPAAALGLSPRLLAGVTPTDGDPEGDRLGAIVAARDNGSLLERLTALDGFRAEHSRDGWRLHNSYDVQQQVNASGAPVFAVSGWRDGAYPDAALKRYLNGENVKVLLGPWDHGGRQAVSPCDDDGAAPLDYAALVVDFQRGVIAGAEDTDYARSLPIRYFTLCNLLGDGWREAASWPPAGTVTREIPLGADGKLSADAPSGEREYAVDLTASSARHSRWYSYINLAGDPIGYPDRDERDGRLLLYEGEPLEAPLTVTGNPALRLRLSITDGHDAAVFAYLEDVGPAGDVRYITEGQLRAALRPVANARDALYRDTGPHHLFRPAELSPLVPGEYVDLEIGLLPVSYTLRPGRRLRLALAGADVDNFSLPAGTASRWRIEHGAGASRLLLPVETRGVASPRGTADARDFSP